MTVFEHAERIVTETGPAGAAAGASRVDAGDVDDEEDDGPLELRAALGSSPLELDDGEPA